jgi:succinyl-diaminopimelate desuccinylase
VDEGASNKLNDKLILEVLFDTSEETDMSTPHYLDENSDEEPDLGIVFDAYWSVRAEKGIERPVFTIDSKDVASAHPENTWYICEMKSSDGSANMIPVTAEAVITGKNLSDADLDQFVANIYDWYRACPFDDVDYHPADIHVTKKEGSQVQITAKVAGAQHGSAPQQNRANGANPIVSLTNFLAFLVDRDILGNNHFSEMCKFIRWAFGTRCFGENHPELLYRFDPVYDEGNGTTYGLTQLFSKDPKKTKLVPKDLEKIHMGIDVRYAIGHHSKGWNGKEGQINGDDSMFADIFEELTSHYQTEVGGAKVTVKTKTVFGPDIRSPRNAHLFLINNAYRSIMGENCPMLATGGATDAHSRLNLVTAGALLSENFGPPVNYHGIDEGAPLPDLENSGKILLYILRQELGISDKQDSNPKNVCHGCCI